MLEFKTGRNYGADQVLLITVINEEADEFDMFKLTASFQDQSRGISGIVDTIRFPHESIGEAVMAAYDLGLYK